MIPVESGICYSIKTHSFTYDCAREKYLNSPFEHSVHEGNAKVKIRKKAKVRSITWSNNSLIRETRIMEEEQRS